MKKIKNKLLDSKRELLQIIALFGCFIAPRIFNFSEIIRVILGGQKPDFSTAKYYYLMKSGNLTIGIILMLYVLFYFFRKSNKEEILNKGNFYHDHSYIWYYFCSKVLGYRKLNLILVPIYMQFRLIVRDTFEDYSLNNDFFPDENIEDIFVKYFENTELNNITSNLNEINLILEDTYPIEKKQLPRNKQPLNMIKITRNNGTDVTRVYNEHFVNSVINVVRKLSSETVLNIYATTNPKHNLQIVKRAFSLADRGNILNLYVFQQNTNNERMFDSKAKKIF